MQSTILYEPVTDFKSIGEVWVYGSTVGHLTCMYEALGSIICSAKRKGEEKKKKEANKVNH